MLQIPSEIRQALNADSIRKNFRVTFADSSIDDICNDKIVSESVTFTESLCSQKVFKLGLCESPTLEFEVVDINNVKGKEFEAYIEIYCDSDVSGAEYKEDLSAYVYPIKIGRFWVDSCKKQADMKHRLITAYGKMAYEDWVADDSVYNDGLSTADKYMSLYAITVLQDMSAFVDKIETETELFPAGEREYEWRAGSRHTKACTISCYISTSYLPVSDQSVFFFTDTFEYSDFNYVLGISHSQNDAQLTLYSQMNRESKGLNYNILHEVENGVRQDIGYIKDTVYEYFKDIISQQTLYLLDGVAYVSYVPVTEIGGVGSDADCVGEYKYTHTSDSSYLYASFGARIVKEAKIKSSSDDYDNFVRYYDDYGNTHYLTDRYGDVRSSNVVGTYDCYQKILKHSQDNDISANNCLNELRQMFSVEYDESVQNTSRFVEYEMEVNENERIKYNEYPNAQSYMQSICELQGKMGRFNRDGNFELMQIDKNFGLYPSNRLYPANDLYPSEANAGYISRENYLEAWYDDDYTKPYSRVTLTFKDSEDDDAEKTISYDIVDWSAADFNESEYQTYTVRNNWVLQNVPMTEEEAQEYLENMAKSLKKIRYMPSDVKLKGQPQIECGDVVEVLLNDGGFETIVLRRTMQGIQSLVDNYVNEGE